MWPPTYQSVKATPNRYPASVLNTATGPVTLIIPWGGFHQSSHKAGPIWDPEIDKLIVGNVLDGLNPAIKIVETDAHINDVKFSRLAADEMLELLGVE